MVELLTPRLRLRRAQRDDLHDLAQVFAHPSAMRYWSTLPHVDVEQTRGWLDSMIAADPAESDDFVIECRGRVVGKAGCWRLPEIGFILHPAYWGQGLAREALSAVIAHLFDRHLIDALTADVDPRNEACLSLLARLGFGETHRASRTFLLGNEWCDSIYLSLPRENAVG